MVEDRFAVGESDELEVSLSREDIDRFATASGDRNPVHLDDEAARAAGFEGRLAHGMLGAALFSRLLGTRFPGPGTIYLGQSLRFLAPVYPDRPLRVRVEILSRQRNRATLLTRLSLLDGTPLIEGEAEVRLPRRG